MPNTRNRLTVRETVYHQISGQNPISFESGFTLYLDNPEQPWLRSPKEPATSEWKALNCGWVEDCKMLVIRNDSPDYRLQFTYDPKGPCFWVPPLDENGQRATTRIYPSDADKLMIRCPSGEARYTVFMIPG